MKETKTTNEVLKNYDPEVVEGVRTCVKMNQSVLLIGETGTGKTTMLNELAKEQGKELIRVSLNGATSTDDLLGKMLAKSGSTYFQYGILVDAMKKGNWIVFDEMNACLPEVLFTIHSLLDDDRKVTLIENDGEIIRPTSDFRFFACINPSDGYAGTKEMNQALVSRFGGVFIVDVFTPDREFSVLKYHGISEKVGTPLVNLATKLRKIRDEGNMNTFVSTRDIIQAGLMIEGGMEVNNGIRFGILNKLTQEERDDLKKDGAVAEYATHTKPMSEEEKKLTSELDSAKKNLESVQATNIKLEKKIEELEKKSSSTGIDTKCLDPKKVELLRALGIEL